MMRFLVLFRLSENSAGQKLPDCIIGKIRYWQFLPYLKSLSFTHAELFTFSSETKFFLADQSGTDQGLTSLFLCSH